MPLVVYLARRFSGRNEPMNDLVQVGAIGLIKAIDRFDPERKLEFSTYATPTILGEIKRHFRDTGWLIHVPRRAQEMQTTLNAARADLNQELGRAPTVKELAERHRGRRGGRARGARRRPGLLRRPARRPGRAGRDGARAPDARHRSTRASSRSSSAPAARGDRRAARGRARDPAAALRREQDPDRDRRASSASRRCRCHGWSPAGSSGCARAWRPRTDPEPGQTATARRFAVQRGPRAGGVNSR